MKRIKDELQDIIIGNGQEGDTSQLKKSTISLGEMRRQAQDHKNRSISKVKKSRS